MQPDPAQIEAFLRENPRFLAERPLLYAAIEPPQRFHGEALADHMAAQLAAFRTMLRETRAENATLLATIRAGANMLSRVQAAVLAIMAATDIADCVATILPDLMGVDAAMLCAEDDRPGFRQLPQGTVRRLMQGRLVQHRNAPKDAELLHVEAAQLAARDVLVRLPMRRPALLALVSRDPGALPVTGDNDIYAFLGRAIAARCDDS
jgi:uncharacterized protein YigA (DUF484 family)